MLPAKFRGSISAEHGIGVHKPAYLHLSKSASAISLMQQLKTLMDPNDILNPYKILPRSARGDSVRDREW